MFSALSQCQLLHPDPEEDSEEEEERGQDIDCVHMCTYTNIQFTVFIFQGSQAILFSQCQSLNIY